MAMDGYLEPLDVMCEGLFDNIDDFLDFSGGENVMVDLCINNNENQQLAPPPAPAPTFPCSDDKTGLTMVSDNKICEDDLNINDDWFSKFLNDDTEFNIKFPVPPTITPVTCKQEDEKDSSLFRYPSPNSVLEQSNNQSTNTAESFTTISCSSSSSTTIDTTADIISLPIPVPIPARARTKRPRPTITPLIPTPLLLPAPEKKFKKKRINSEEPPSAARKCMHCGIQKTPQWRAGPMGPKTLCNACGVRYKSGRLFPEYRPAASPTFVPSVHSNSHKKVVEMRIKATTDEEEKVKTTAAKSCELLRYIHS